MRIFFFDDRGHTLRGGQQTLLDVLDRAVELGHEAICGTCIDGPLARQARDRGASTLIWPLPKSLSRYDGSFRTASRFSTAKAVATMLTTGLRFYGRLLQLRPDAVYLSSVRPTLLLWPMVLDPRPSLWYAQGNVDFGAISAVASLVPSQLASVSKASQACFGFDESAEPAPPVVPIGIDTSTILTRAAGISGPIRILCVGEISPLKGQLELVTACEALCRLGKPVELTLVGGASSETNQRYRDEVLSAAQTVVIKDLGWLDDLSHVYAEHDVLVLLSKAEGTPRVFVEAFAAGIPVVATAVGGIPAFIGDRRGSYLVEAGEDPEAIARKIAKAIDEADPLSIAQQAAGFDRRTMQDRLLGLVTGQTQRPPNRKERLTAHLRSGRHRLFDR